MVVKNIGSIATDIQNRVDNVPSGISGAQLLNIVDNARLYVEEYTGVSIGSTAIAEKYQPAITNLAQSDLLMLMEMQGGDFSTVRLGEFSVSKGQGSNTQTASEGFRQLGMEQLKRLGTAIRYKRVY